MWLALCGALIIGLSLSIFGSGGSILTIPVLLYLLDMPAVIAIPASLLIVAIISAFNASIAAYRQQISWHHVAWFGIPGMFATYAGAWLALQVTPRLQLTVLIVLMLLAAARMWQSPVLIQQAAKPKLWLLSGGLMLGVITGFVGVGGGFLLVPALVLLAALPLPLAVGSSLVIISLNALAGFGKYYLSLTEQGLSFDWHSIAMISAGGVLGGLAGSLIASRIPARLLRKGFALFLLAMAAFILFKSVL